MPTMTDIRPVLAELRAALQRLYGERLKRVILYGSWARGEADAGSDVDVMVVLQGPLQPGREIDRTLDLLVDIGLKHRTLISVYPVTEEDYEATQSPVLINARREGVVV